MPCDALSPGHRETLYHHDDDPPPSPPWSPHEPLLGSEMPLCQGQALRVPQVHGDSQGGWQGQTCGGCSVLV